MMADRAAATEAGVPAFCVLHDRVLLAIARADPRTIAQFGSLAGVGPNKARAYGQAVIEVLSGAADEHRVSGEG